MGGISWLSVMALVLTSAASVVALLREKRDESAPEHRLRRRLKPVLFIITGVGLLLGMCTIRTSDKASKDAAQKHLQERRTDQNQIDTLNGSIQTLTKTNETQYDRHQKELRGLNDQLADLKKDIATEDLRKKMQTLQARLDKSLTPVPKATLETGFWVAPLSPLVSSITKRAEGNHVKFDFSIVNHSDVSAKAVSMWLRICDDCKYASEPVGTKHVEGAFDKERVWPSLELPIDVRWERLTVEIEIPAQYTQAKLATKYRCENCVVEKDWNFLTLNIDRSLTPSSTTP